MLGNILDNTELMDTLSDSKVTSTEIKEQQRETREGLAALRQRFEDQGEAAAESAAAAPTGCPE